MTVKKFRELCKTEEIFEELAEYEEVRRENDTRGLVLIAMQQLGYERQEIKRVLAAVSHAYETHTGEEAIRYFCESDY